ncbi:MAG TPA: magnesium transporter, partial [Thermoanaerobaculia bacterium]|nr:magnesium transporter [Thermoanaerobaculia bacterium]
VVVRGLALGELDLRRSTAVILKEVAVGLLNGLGTGLVLALVAYFWERNLILAAILLVAETVNLVVAGLAGASIPLLLRRLNLDPALGSSIFVTTATDVGGFLSFLGIATLLLHHLM